MHFLVNDMQISLTRSTKKNVDEKFSLPPIAFNLGSAYVSEDSKKEKKC